MCVGGGGVSFIDLRSFKINKRVILFCKELVSRNRNLNQHKSRNFQRKSINLLFLLIYYFNPIFKF